MWKIFLQLSAAGDAKTLHDNINILFRLSLLEALGHQKLENHDMVYHDNFLWHVFQSKCLEDIKCCGRCFHLLGSIKGQNET